MSKPTQRMKMGSDYWVGRWVWDPLCLTCNDILLTASPCFLSRQVTKAEGAALAGRFGCLFFEVSACLDFEHVQHVFHEAVREVRRELDKSPLARPLFISEEKTLSHQTPLTARHGLASCTFNTLSTASLKEMPTVAQAKLVTVKSSRAQSKRKAPTLTLLKGFKIF